eukprot:941472-Prymnesium_polylepis.1
MQGPLIFVHAPCRRWGNSSVRRQDVEDLAPYQQHGQVVIGIEMQRPTSIASDVARDEGRVQDLAKLYALFHLDAKRLCEQHCCALLHAPCTMQRGLIWLLTQPSSHRLAVVSLPQLRLHSPSLLPSVSKADGSHGVQVRAGRSIGLWALVGVEPVVIMRDVLLPVWLQGGDHIIGQ